MTRSSIICSPEVRSGEIFTQQIIVFKIRSGAPESADLPFLVIKLSLSGGKKTRDDFEKIGNLNNAPRKTVCRISHCEILNYNAANNVFLINVPSGVRAGAVRGGHGKSMSLMSRSRSRPGEPARRGVHKR